MSDLLYGDNFSTFEKQDKVLVALSGGVDSSVCVKILQEQGFDVTALVIRFSDAHDKALLEAKKAADKLNVPLHIADATEVFKEHVITPFCNEYCEGITPSPCVMCNPLVKFRTLAATADSLGIRFIASGHYARVTEHNGEFYIAKPESAERDQSYMLYRLPQDILSRLILPLGEFEKPDIRQMAAEADLPCADSPDSQEICFIPDGDYAKYIESRGLACKQGNFIAPDGKNLGPHKGVLHYTVGQRRGIGIALGEPIFVKEIMANGDIQLAKSGDEFYSCIKLNNLSLVKDLSNFDDIAIKIRSRAACTPCKVCVWDGIATVTFTEPVRAPAPGQSAVFYCNELVLGGGVIICVE